jgi:hypothetical protein
MEKRGYGEDYINRYKMMTRYSALLAKKKKNFCFSIAEYVCSDLRNNVNIMRLVNPERNSCTAAAFK